MAVASDAAEAGIVNAALVMPVDGSAVGGDFCLIEDVGSRTVALVGDVTGKGDEAAPYAGRLRAELKPHVDREHDPAELLERLNAIIYSDPDFDRFTTACAVIIERVSWGARWAFAGHLPPHWLDTGLPVDGATPGLPLGLEPNCGAVSAQRRPLRPGEGMLLFSDGLEDVRGPGGDRFGSARVTHTLASQFYGATPQSVVQGMKEIACEFGSQQLADDLCLLALRLT
jgi:serine phosphatase RsbU (regulator of sigma subunit)